MGTSRSLTYRLRHNISPEPIEDGLLLHIVDRNFRFDFENGTILHLSLLFATL
jgi:hypothetical protein